MALMSIDHIVIRVKDLDEGIAAYRDRIGLTLERVGENEALGIKQTFFPLHNGGYVEVVAPLDAESAVGRALESRGEGVHSIVFSADDVAATAAQMKENGVALIGEGAPQVFVHPKSSHGVLLQLTETKR